jgi:hypothetical protein
MDAPDSKEKALTRNADLGKDTGAATVEFAAIGEEVGIWLTGRRWHHNEDGGTMVYRNVQWPCNDPTGGHWLCLTHQDHLIVAPEMGRHLSEGRHHLVWFCYQHGPEMETAR